MIQKYLMEKLIGDISLGQKIRNDDDIDVEKKYALDAIEKNPNVEGTLADELKNHSNELTRIQSSVNALVKLPAGATTGDAEIELAKIGINGETYETLQDSIQGQIQNYRDVKVSNEAPTIYENPAVWVNTADNSDSINFPEIKDNTVTTVDTWSSYKINHEISALSDTITSLLNRVSELERTLTNK